MQYRTIFLIFMSMVMRAVLGAINLANFQQEALIQHNYYRQLHCTNPMILNASISTIAQQYANYLAANSIFNHSGIAGYGENLYTTSSSQGITFVNGSVPTFAWYNEILLYNYSAPGFSGATGHFTQVVWTDSVQLGIGIALTSNNQSAYVVANYYPPGNYQNQFGAKVPPVCASSTVPSPAPTTGSLMNSTAPRSSTTTPPSTAAPASTTGQSMNSSAPPSTAASVSATGQSMNSSVPSPSATRPPTTTATTSTIGNTTSSNVTLSGGSTMRPTALNSTAVGMSYGGYHLLATVAILGIQFGPVFN